MVRNGCHTVAWSCCYGVLTLQMQRPQTPPLQVSLSCCSLCDTHALSQHCMSATTLSLPSISICCNQFWLGKFDEPDRQNSSGRHGIAPPRSHVSFAGRANAITLSPTFVHTSDGAFLLLCRCRCQHCRANQSCSMCHHRSHEQGASHGSTHSSSCCKAACQGCCVSLLA